jgi:hypothetical protein
LTRLLDGVPVAVPAAVDTGKDTTRYNPADSLFTVKVRSMIFR